MKAQPGVRVSDDQTYFIDMRNGEFFPLEFTGIKILGCPIGTQETFDHFMADLLSFENGYAISHLAHHYANALQQCRQGNKQGGLGLTQAALIAPAANFVALPS